MNATHDDDHDEYAIYLDEEDVIAETVVDDEDLPDVEDDDFTDGDAGSSDSDKADGSLHVFDDHSGEIYTVACSPTDSTLVATGGGDDRGFLWRLDDGKSIAVLDGHHDSVCSIEFSRDGKLVATGGMDGIVKIWTCSGVLKSTLEGSGGGVEWVRWHPRSYVVMAGMEDRVASMWNADKGYHLNSFYGHSASVTCGDFTPDGRSACTGSEDGSLRVWNLKTGKCTHVIRGYPYHTSGLTCLAITSDSTLVLSGSLDGSVHVVNIITGQVATSLPGHTHSVECIALSSSSSLSLVATGGVDGRLVISDRAHSLARCVCDHDGEGVTSVRWMGESKYVATGCMDGRVCVWDSLSGECVETFYGHSGPVESLAVSMGGRFIVSTSLDHTARVFETSCFE